MLNGWKTRLVAAGYVVWRGLVEVYPDRLRPFDDIATGIFAALGAVTIHHAVVRTNGE